MSVRLVFLLFILLLPACVQALPPSDSGIEGIVTIGPMCPVIHADSPCPDQPYQATLSVLFENGEKVVKFLTDEKGRFRVSLAAGNYILHPESPNVMPSAADIPFTVYEHKFTWLKITYDSGIR